MNIPNKTFPGFIFLNLEHPLVAWECYRGSLISSYINASNETRITSMRMAGLINSEDNINFINELLFEHIRAEYFSLAVSRLSCLYAFGDRTSAEVACTWGDDGCHFRIENLVAVGIGANRVQKADANWITKATRHANGLIKKSYIPHIKDYWNGIPFNDKPHWEYLIDGYAIIWGIEHKNLAYQVIKNQMPNSLSLLEISSIADRMGFYLGHIYPRIYRTSKTDFALKHIIDMHDLGSNYGNFIASLEKYRGPINRQLFESDRQFFNENGGLRFTVPDLRKYGREFTLSNQKLYGLSSLKIHSA